MLKKKSLKLNCNDINQNTTNHFEEGNCKVFLYHNPDEPISTSRLIVEVGELKAELLPSKGLSLGQAFFKEKKIFWDAPYTLPDPDKLNLWSDEVLINGEPLEGFTFLKTFCGGIEFYGLKNWGMPGTDELTGNILPLHGETSNIPVEEVKIELEENNIKIKAEYIYRDMKGAESQPWYQNGSPLFRVHKFYELCLCDNPQIIVRDAIENISGENQEPDWGYHITFYPHLGTKLIVESETQELRGEGEIPGDIVTWTPSKEIAKREEVGIIHKNLQKGIVGERNKCTALIQHPEGEKILFHFPPTPYFQTWSCKGGAGSDEFKLKSGQSLLEKNWDGLGIEIGSSALDHDGNIDESVEYNPILKPGEIKVIEMEVEFVDTI